MKAAGAVLGRFITSPIAKLFGDAQGSGRTAASRIDWMVEVLYAARTVAAVAAAALLGYAVGWLDHRADLPMGWSVVSGEARVVDGDTLEVDGIRIRLHGLDAPERYQRCLTSAGVEYRCGVRATAVLNSLLHSNNASPPDDRSGGPFTGGAVSSGPPGLIRRSLSGLRPSSPICIRSLSGLRPSTPICIRSLSGLRPSTPLGTVVTKKSEVEAITCLSHETDRWNRRIARCFTDDADINRWLVQNGHALAYRRYSQEYAIDEAHALEQRWGLWAGRFVPPRDWRRGVRLRPPVGGDRNPFR